MNKIVRIGDKEIGRGKPAFIVAEIGINHNGDVGLARETIDAAIEGGADAVKLQTYKTSGFIHRENPIFSAVQSCELTRGEYTQLFQYARDRNMIIFSTPECDDDINYLESLDVPAMKIASMDMNYKSFIQRAAGLGKPMILSTGMSYFYEVGNSVRWIKETGNNEIVLFHCVSCYPTPPEECNLSVMKALAEAFSYPVGFSDHTIGIEIPFAAVCMGASVIEKHFTLDKSLNGPDHSSSADTADMKQLVAQVRAFEKAVGTGIKEPSVSERITRLKKRRSVFAGKLLKAGETVTIESLVFLTPSVPESQLEDLDNFLGRVVKEDIPVNGLVTASLLK